MEIMATYVIICSIIILPNAARKLEKDDITYLGEHYINSDTKIPYIVPDRDFTTVEKRMIDQAIDEIMKNTCIEFLPYNKVLGWSKCPEMNDGISKMNDLFSTQPQPRLLCFTKTSSDNITCHYSPQGVLKIKDRVVYQNMGYIQLGTSPNCFRLSVVLHEIMHAMGFDHEHQRPDRDNFVRLEDSVDIKKEKIKPFMKTFGLPYDVCSITHYSDMDGVRKLPNVTSECRLKELSLQHTLSVIDIAKINEKYSCEPQPNSFGDFRPGTYLFKHFGNLKPSYELDIAIKICLLTISLVVFQYHKTVLVTLRTISYSTILVSQVMEATVMALFYFKFITTSNCTTKCQVWSLYYLKKLQTQTFQPLLCLNIMIVAVKALSFLSPSNYHPIQIEDLKLYIRKDLYQQDVEINDITVSDVGVLDDEGMSEFHWAEKIILIVLIVILFFVEVEITITLFMVIAPLIEFWRDPVSSLYWCEDTRKLLDYLYN